MYSLIELDKTLYKTLKFLESNWYNPEVGIVACCLKDNDKEVFATSKRNGINWSHAERNAYDKFKAIYGEPSQNSVFVITLSPCVKELKYRGENSCTELLKSLKIKYVHFGILDTMHLSKIEEYSDFGFTATLTDDNNLFNMCSKLMNMFSEYDSRINTDLLSIKRELGDSFFTEINQIEEEQFEKASTLKL